MSEASRGKNQRRMLTMVAELMRGNMLDRKSASEQFQMPPDCAYRMLRLIEEQIPGVEREKSGGLTRFSLNADVVLEREPLEEETNGFAEALGSSFASAFARCFKGTTYEQKLLGIRRNLITKLSMGKQRYFEHISRKIFVRSGHEELLADKEGLLGEVVDSILRQKWILIRYRRFHGVEDDLRVKPYSLAVYDGHLYVVGATDDVPYYPYRFARILDLDLTDDRFEYPSPSEYDPEVIFRDSIGIFVDPEPCDIRLQLDATWAVFAGHHRWHESQCIESKLDDGSMILRMHVRLCKELERWILGMGEHAIVLEPEGLRKCIAARLVSAAGRYAAQGLAAADSLGPGTAPE